MSLSTAITRVLSSQTDFLLTPKLSGSREILVFPRIPRIPRSVGYDHTHYQDILYFQRKRFLHHFGQLRQSAVYGPLERARERKYSSPSGSSH